MAVRFRKKQIFHTWNLLSRRLDILCSHPDRRLCSDGCRCLRESYEQQPLILISVCNDSSQGIEQSKRLSRLYRNVLPLQRIYHKITALLVIHPLSYSYQIFFPIHIFHILLTFSDLFLDNDTIICENQSPGKFFLLFIQHLFIILMHLHAFYPYTRSGWNSIRTASQLLYLQRQPSTYWQTRRIQGS